MQWASPGNSEGNNRIFIVHIPPSFSFKKVYPVVFIFHGGGGSGERAAKYGFNEVADKNGAIVVYPTGTSSAPDEGYTWNNGLGFGLDLNTKAEKVDDVGFVRSIVAKLQKDLSKNIDMNRIYAAGVSNGGLFTNRLGAEAGDLFAGICSVAGATESRMEKSAQPRALPTPKTPMNVLLVRGTRDAEIMYFGGKIEGKHRPGSPQFNGDTMDMLRFWAEANQRSLVPQKETVEATQGETGTGYVFTQEFGSLSRLTKGGELKLMTLIGGEHEWGGKAVLSNSEFNQRVWAILSKFTKIRTISFSSDGGM